MHTDELILLAGIPAIFFLAALVQAITGFGSALVIVPLVTVLNDPVTAVVAATVASAVLAAGATVRERRFVDRALTRRLTVAGVCGMPVGLGLLVLAEPDVITMVIAGVLLVLVLMSLIRDRTSVNDEAPTRAVATRAWGALSGALLTSTGMNGPALVFALRGMSPSRFRATLQAVFVGQDVVALALLAALGQFSVEAVVIAAAGLISLPLGWWAGDRVFARVNPASLRLIVLAGLAATAASMLVLA